MASVLDKVRAFVARLAPDAVCETCIAGCLELPQRDTARLCLNVIVGTDGFTRSFAACTLCGGEGTHVRKTR